MSQFIHASIIKSFLLFCLPLVAATFIGESKLIYFIFALVTALTLSLVFYHIRPSNWLTHLIKICLVISYLVLLFFVLFKSILYDFTGKGFTEEVYYHLDWESFKIGFNEYLWPMLGLILIAISYILLAVFLGAKNQSKPNHKHLLLTTFCYIFMLWLSPINAFVSGLIDYKNQSNRVALTSSQIDILVSGGFINPVDIPKKHVVSSKTDQNTNLILIYLESFNQFLVDHPDFKYLTPNLNRLGKKYKTFEHENSSFVTIEGLISSMCGTFLPLQAGNDSFMKKSDAMADLPCLGDILQQSGYQQYFLGGAKMNFAGKGDFLNAHGYQNVWGMEYWKTQGKSSEKNIWGLSDSELLKEAIKTIRTASQQPPFNLTLLTLGTHIPGYVYEGCESISHEDPFLAAISCTDLLIGKFIDSLENEQLLDNTLFLIVADHGVFPNPAMTELFGEQALDRRLVGITNYSGDIPDIPISSYDLAPTILEWLGVNHNAKFLFGLSTEEKSTKNHKHVTRYRDWIDGTTLKAASGECRAMLKDVKILNSCEKNDLKQLTQQVLDSFAKQEFGKKLNCEVNVTVNLHDTEKQLSIDGINYYYDFYHNGRFMDVRNYQSGYFILAFNKERQIIEKKYYPAKYGDSSEVLQNLQAEIKNAQQFLGFQFSDQTSFKLFDSQNNFIHQTENQPAQFSINLCEAES